MHMIKNCDLTFGWPANYLKNAPWYKSQIFNQRISGAMMPVMQVYCMHFAKRSLVACSRAPALFPASINKCSPAAPSLLLA